MANSEHLAKLKEGIAVWNDWRKANSDTLPDLCRADLSWANLRVQLSGANPLLAANPQVADFIAANFSDVNLSRANLSSANLSHANLVGATLIDADLRKANLLGADLSDSNLSKANLSGADLGSADLAVSDLSGADLTGADLTRAYLSGADLARASIGWTTFGDNDLSEVMGLETVRHDGPSTIGIDTIYSSQGKIPLAFLRGAGVPENFITFMGSLTGNALEFYSCFISYSTKDEEFADRLYADLQNKGVRCWFAPHNIQAGKKIHEQIDEAIRRYERLLLILSPDSMKSPWVKTEIRKARKREIEEKRRVLFPVSVVPFTDIRTWESFYADEGIDLAEEIREYYIPDFSNWMKDHNSYLRSLQKLLDGLKAEGPKAA
jgi:hypothetical protein